ncbi:EAL domain-containing protein [Luteimonas sp. 8-5]|uniref:sensor domain-containing protein n=1 Tax=Luteimonas sp. 8-5 TaxID=3039387 RepID=UPI0024363845|nr:EAL domain-containing protein [Luteimonas sp. 8-5]MDG6347580.1 EAL domain-containing protein [Luteimonas sp. 8-5]
MQMDAEDTLAELLGCLADPTLKPEHRDALQRACDALQVAQAVATAERHRYRALFDAVPDPVSVIAWDGTVLDLNSAGIAAYRRPRHEIVGQPIHVLNPELPRDHMRPVYDALSRGGTYVIEVTNMRSDGTRFPVEVHSANFEFEGQPCLVAVARDLSRRAEAELRYRELMGVVDKGIVVRGSGGEIVYANAAAIRMLNVESGLSLDEEMQPGRWKIIDENGRELERDELPAMRALRTGAIVDNTVLGYYNLRLRKLTWLAVTAVPQFAPDADIPHQVLSLFTDVTELKRDSDLFDRVQALAHIGGWQWDAGRDRLHLSEEALRILGLHATPPTMEAALEVLVPNDRLRARAALERTLESGTGFDLELQGRRGDELLWVRAIGEAVGGNALAMHLTGTLQDITERKRAEEALRVQARTDPLTGLLNRDAILGELAEWLDDPAMSQVAVLYIDLDRFKVVNDVLGHGAGDELLISAARRIARAVRDEGLIARFGGDEFLVVCGIGDDSSRPERIADAILDAFGDSFRFDNEEFAITASIGIARTPADGDAVQALIQNADTAMYDSKRRIRNGWQAYSPALAHSQQERHRVEAHLRRAAENNEFHLVYQPQVDLASGRVVAAEALIRWENDQLGEMRPDHFIAHAEITGDIVRIGGWVLREACRQVRQWVDDGRGPIRVAVNVSYRQFLGDDLAGTVRGLLHEFGLPGAALELEFTERVLIEDAPDTQRTFAALRDLGVMLTIDDFGEGYSALNYLRRLPIHGLKLSHMFLQGVPHNESDVAVCQAVCGIARSLGLSLVAEGVEHEAQRRFLLELGVRTGQGFLFAPGLSPLEFRERLGQAFFPRTA